MFFWTLMDSNNNSPTILKYNFPSFSNSNTEMMTNNTNAMNTQNIANNNAFNKEVTYLEQFRTNKRNLIVNALKKMMFRK